MDIGGTISDTEKNNQNYFEHLTECKTNLKSHKFYQDINHI